MAARITFSSLIGWWAAKVTKSYPHLIADGLCKCRIVQVKFRVHNYIYEEILSAEMFEDMRVNGVNLQVCAELRQEDAKSVAVGQFRHAVEILTIVPCSNEVPQQMDVEVKVIIWIFCQYLNFDI